MKESGFWSSWVRPALAGQDPVRVENPAMPGTPDVNYIGGWIELKYNEKWPARPETPVKAEHFTAEQRTWLVRRIHFGGRAHLILGVGSEALLFRGDVAAKYLDYSNQADLRALAQTVFTDKSDMRKRLRAELERR